ncbi:MAG TPA: hypothetical protein VF777_11170 [Phycisphaerales bacterium]
MRTVSRLIRSLAPAALLFASAAHAAIVNIAQQGVLATTPYGCLFFVGDDGQRYALSTLGGFSAGDRIFVQGSYNDMQATVCFGTGGPTINATAVRAAFAGVGTLIRVGNQTRLQTPDGRIFQVQTLSNFRAGTTVYVQGQVNTLVSPPRIESNVIGAGFSGFGRLTSTTTGALRFRSDSGVTYALDRLGSQPDALVGDYCFVEGIVGKTTGGVTALNSVSARPAFTAKGTVVSTAGGKAIDPDTLIFSNPITAAALAPFNVGDSVYLYGRSTDDYDFGEVKVANNVRQSTAGVAYTANGFLNTTTRTLINEDDGTVVNLESVGNPFWNPNGSYAYIAGAILSTGPGTVTLRNNETRVGFVGQGTIVTGFGCSPIIAFDGGGYLFPKNTTGFQLGDYVRVRGGITFSLPCEDFLGLVDNSIVFGDPNQCELCQ